MYLKALQCWTLACLVVAVVAQSVMPVPCNGNLIYTCGVCDACLNRFDNANIFGEGGCLLVNPSNIGDYETAPGSGVFEISGQDCMVLDASLFTVTTTSGDDCVLVNDPNTAANGLILGDGADCVVISGTGRVVGTIDAAGGNDCIVTTPGATTHQIILGSGDDILIGDHLDTSGGRIFSTTGSKEIQITNGVVGQIVGGDSFDTITIRDTVVSGNIEGRGGNDCISVINSTFTTIDGGTENDKIRVARSSGFFVKGDEGVDLIGVSFSTFTSVTGGEGSDEIVVLQSPVQLFGNGGFEDRCTYDELVSNVATITADGCEILTDLSFDPMCNSSPPTDLA